MTIDHSTTRQAGDRIVVDQARRQVQSFLDELKNGTRNYGTISSLNDQSAQAYRGRCVLELLQNAHDALARPPDHAPQKISFVLRTRPEPVLLVANSGHPFREKDFIGLCQLGQSPKDPNESVGNKGLGFRSVLEVSTSPEIWSTAPVDGDPSFIFRFDPAVSDKVEAAVSELRDHGLPTRSPFDPAFPLVDWSEPQLDRFREHLAATDVAREAKQLSPYSIPLPIHGGCPEVEALINDGHVTVVRLPLDGGSSGSREDAIQSVKDQLQRLDACSMAFLPDLETLVIDIDGEPTIFQRIVASDTEFSHRPRTRQQRLQVDQEGAASDDPTTRQFQVWTRTIGGPEDPEQADRIRALVARLPNRWPEVHRVTVSVAVEEASAPAQGRFVIFLPTETTTGTGAHLHAPFYGSLDRRQVNFSDPYNAFLLDTVLDLILDAVADLVSVEPDAWRARAVVDLLSSATRIGGRDVSLMDLLDERATERGEPLHDLPLIHCDHGWCVSREARTMPPIRGDAGVRSDQWRHHATFAIVSMSLDGRRSAVEALVEKLDGSLDPTHAEWQQTVEHVAKAIQDGQIVATWNDFLTSLVAILPEDIRSGPMPGDPDPLAEAKFLPDQNGRLISASDSVKLFFRPVRGGDDAEEFVGDVPGPLQRYVAFLHESVETQDGPQRRNTPVQRFLHRRFVRDFAREDLLQQVVLPAIPDLPVSHGTDDTDLCYELFKWTLKLLGNDPPDTLLPSVKRLPVPCHGGWYAMADAVFGPDWPDRHGDDLWRLTQELPGDLATRLHQAALLPPDDPSSLLSNKNTNEGGPEELLVV